MAAMSSAMDAYTCTHRALRHIYWSVAKSAGAPVKSIYHELRDALRENLKEVCMMLPNFT